MEHSLCCTACSSVIADSKNFGVILQGRSKHVYINQSQVGKTILVSKVEKLASAKEGVLKCSTCSKKVGSKLKKRYCMMRMSYFVDGEETKVMVELPNKFIVTKIWRKTVPKQFILGRYNNNNRNKRDKKRNPQKPRYLFQKKDKNLSTYVHRTTELKSHKAERKFPKKKKSRKLRNNHDMKMYVRRLLDDTERKMDLAQILEFDEFSQIINSSSLKLHISHDVMKLLCHKDFIDSILSVKVERVLKKVLDSDFMESHVPRFILNGVMGKEDVQLVMKFYKNLVKFCKDRFYDIELRPLQGLIKKQTQYIDDEILGEFRELEKKMEEIEKQYKQSLLPEETKEDLDKFSIENSQDHPTLKELINRPKRGELPKNQIKWNSFEEYVSTHYKLLREDFIEPLRSGLNGYFSKGTRNRALKVYSHVKVQKIGINKFTKDFCFEVNLKQKSSRYNNLKYGTLVCLFKTSEFSKSILIDEGREVEFILAIVLSSVHKREQKTNNLMITPIHNTIVDIRENFVLIESPSYYKSVAPVLSCLRKLEKDKFPFHDVLIEGSSNNNPPEYIKKYPNVDISGILEKGLKKTLNVLEKSIPKQASFLNDSQCSALENILTNKVALVKGPPGTGKSFVGVQATKILLTHLKKNRIQHPIVAICYTNHALDQFLMGVKDFTSDLVRVGGRSKEPELEEFNFNKKLRERKSRSHGVRALDRDIYLLKDLIDSKLCVLSDFKIIQKHVNGLDKKLERKWNSGLTPDKIFELWEEGKEKEVKKRFKKEQEKKKKKNIDRNQNPYRLLKSENGVDKRIENHSTTVEDTEVTPIEIEDTVEKSERDSLADGWVEVKPRVRYLKINHTEEDIRESFSESSSESEDEDIYDYDNRTVYEEERDLIELEGLDYNDNVDGDFGEDFDDDEIVVKKSTKFKDYIKKVNSVTKDFWKIKLKGRKTIIENLTESYYEYIHTGLKVVTAKLEKVKKEKSELIDKSKVRILQSASIIGLTSTGAALNYNLLKNLNTGIFIFEEAAELLECQITSLLNEKVQHLILIGDEQQLKPKLNSYQLKLHHGFDISLFERLIKNNMKKATLTVQRRMRPKISNIMRIFYPNIKDHPTVHEYPDVAAVNENVYFLSHTSPETEDRGSKINLEEAQFVSSFTQYLCCQKEYGADDITIITPYRGQKYEIQKRISKKYLKVRVVTIDDFQGEENKIIILSLVRSNKKDSIGFVSITNRIIVSLSRAKYGLYVIGNSDLLLSKSDDWYKIVKHFKNSELISTKLTLKCMKHSNHLTAVSVGDGKMDEMLHGGCSTPCDFQLKCGHSCNRKCHPQNHDVIRCTKKCRKVRSTCKHLCSKSCHGLNGNCGKCVEEVIYRFECGHEIGIKCSDDRTLLKCKAKCHKELPCKHKCAWDCKMCLQNHAIGGKSCLPCQMDVRKECKECKKGFMGKCSKKLNLCTNKCTKMLGCGHRCVGKCGTCVLRRKHLACDKNCKRPLLCGHTCGNHNCKDECPECVEECIFKCDHVKCRHGCDKFCVPCREKCSSRCVHSRCKKFCHELCDRKPCNKRCTILLKCKHQCNGLCGEACPSVCLKCDSKLKETERWKDTTSLMDSKEFMEDVDPKAPTLLYTLKCGHTFEVDGLDNYVKTQFEKSSIGLLGCMLCKCPLVNEPRYKNFIWKTRKEVLNVSLKVKKAKEERERRDRKLVIKAIQGNMGSGHWFKCPNGHLYFIGECGGAMQVGRCGDCGAKIGGTRHTLLHDNHFAPEIDGATAPAYPTL